ncbi:aldo/keto reductase, partial [candidate division KSB1 bacterium]|nr:aldo/keto reductase [candidate division KSB1 bacterium]
MQKRKLGNTGLELSIMGMGGFHFIETAKNEVEFLLNTYLDHGGNYIETAADYGHGISERKIGMTVARRRQDYFLASKCVKRNRNDAEKSIETSLRNLNTDYLDILFLHAVQTAEDVNAIFSANGAMEAVIAAQKAGKIRYIGISGHGYPLALQQALQQTDFDVLLTGFNYIDRFNFPSIETE